MAPRDQVLSLVASVSRNRRDALRLALQTAAAAAATYGVMTALGLPHMSWAVIAALFTIHPSADSTMRSGLGRLMGTLIGVVVGLAAVMVVAGEEYFLARLVIATAVSGAVVAVWPTLNYVGVAAVVMALHPDPGLLGAFGRGLAIVVGAVLGTMATLVVWPDFGRNRTLALIQDALDSIRTLLAATLDGIETDGRQQRDAAHAEFHSILDAARGTASQSWFGGCRDGRLKLPDALAATERLWHALVVLDRVVSNEGRSLDDAALAAIGPSIAEVQRAACAIVDSLVTVLQGGEAVWPTPRLSEAVARSRDAASGFITDHGHLQDQRSRALYALSFALDEVERNLGEIAGVVAPEAAAGTLGAQEAGSSQTQSERAPARTTATEAGSDERRSARSRRHHGAAAR